MSVETKKFDSKSLPPNWKCVALKEVVSKLVDGSHNPPVKNGSGYPMLSARNVENNKIVYDDYRRISKTDYEREHKRTKIAPGDVLLTIVGTIGRSAIVPEGTEPLTLQRSVAVITPAGLLPKFLMYQFQSPSIQRYFEAQARGTAQKGVYLGTLGATPVCIAPIDEQKDIVAEIEKQFSRLDEGVANLKRVKANLKRYKAAVLKAAVEGRLVETEAALARRESRSYETGAQLLQHILEARRSQWKNKGKYKEPAEPNMTNLTELPEGWCWITVDTMAFVTKLAGFEYTKYVKYSPDGDLAVIKAENAGRNGFKRTEISRIKSNTVSQLTRSKLKAGDLLMVFVGAGTGNVARVPDDQPYFLGPNIAMIRVESRVASAPYLEMFLRSPIGNSLALGFAKAVAQPSLSMGTIRMIPIAIPVLSEQQRIVAEVDRRLSLIYDVANQVDTNLKRAETLRQALLSQAFNGKLI